MDKKIPYIKNNEGWKEILLVPTEEKLVSLKGLREDKVKIKPMYYLQEINGAIDDCFVREMIMNMLLLASSKLPKGYKLVILDAWRPIEVQEALFQIYKEQFKNENPHFSKEELMEYTQKYVSLPSFDKLKPSPHNTGGAVDLTIENEKGELLDMGTEYDEMINRASTRYYEERLESGEVLTEKEMKILKNRRLLFHIMTEVGFTNYNEEWWHYDFGNQFWAKQKNKIAFYGAMSL